MTSKWQDSWVPQGDQSRAQEVQLGVACRALKEDMLRVRRGKCPAAALLEVGSKEDPRASLGLLGAAWWFSR